MNTLNLAGERDSAFQEPIEIKERRLIEQLVELDSLIVAYSGGVDSSLLAYYATELLGAKAKIVIAVSPSLAMEDLESARAQALLFDWNLTEVTTNEHEKPEYLRNDNMRCYFCKATLFEVLTNLSKTWSVEHIIYGANLDDDSDYRPGKVAAGQYRILSPLHAAGLTKQEIRHLARKAGLPAWDKPQDACLASRIPRDIPVSIETLSSIELAERFVKSLGFRQVRVRHRSEGASVEVGVDELHRFTSDPSLAKKVEAHLLGLGYRTVMIDPSGYIQGGADHSRVAVAPQTLTL